MKNEMMSFIEQFSFRSDKWKMKLSVSMGPFVRLSLCPFVYVSVYPFVCLSNCLFVRLSISLFLHVTVWPFVCLSFCPFIGFFRSILFQLSLVGNHWKPSLQCRHWSQIEIVWSRMMSFLWKFERIRSFLIKWALIKGITDNVINW